MNPDRILVGECRGPETMAMLWSFATGHAGMTSVHGESAEHALQNLVRFALVGAPIDAEQAIDWVREVDLVVHCDRPRSFGAGERRFLPRRIDEIVEVAGVEGRRLTLNPLFEGPAPSPLARKRTRIPGRARTGRLPCRVMTRLAPVLIAFLVAITVGCDGGNDEVATQPPPATTTPEKGTATLERAARSALTENRRLGLCALEQPIPVGRALDPTALASLRAAAQNRRSRGIRVRMLENRREILSLRLDPSYARATAIVLDRQRVQPSRRNGRPLGRAAMLNERARYELRRLGQSDRFVVWRVVLLQ